MKTHCTICQREAETKHLPIYVIGSEGVEVCHVCDINLVKHIRHLMDIASAMRMQAYKQFRGEK